MEESTRAASTRAPLEAWDGPELLAGLRTAAAWLERHTDEVNALNVFPVPDGDTGTNMSLTLNSALEGVTPLPSAAALAERVGYWAMMRGRGNSGIILSQVLRGFAQGVAGHERMDAAVFVAGLSQASATAYQAVMKPVEGTMLTVIRETAEAARAAAGLPLADLLEATARAAHESVRRTPTLLKTLRDAGVVDSGGQGLALIFEGLVRHARGEPLPDDVPAAVPLPAADFADMHGEDAFGYCTNFVIQGRDMPFAQIRVDLAALGQSVAVAGDGELIKVHLHTERPGDALNYAVQHGALANIEITNMDAQHAALKGHAVDGAILPQSPALSSQPLDLGRVGLVAVASGAGFTAIFQSMNVGAVIEGGPTSNPSTADLLAAVERLPQGEVIVLPNNSNVLMAARQAAELSGKQVEVVASRTLPQGLAALLAFNYQADLGANAQAMRAAVGRVCTGEITTAVRDATVDGVSVRAGQTIGLLDGDLVAAGEVPTEVVGQLLERMRLDEREIVSIYYGQARERADAEELAQQIRARHPDLAEVEVQSGGQALYDYILSAE
ncbi:MAG TPA: DAK2 domain-containing protein [Roseiflexaceae bacterium]|nr:DAK2 domain-containing protein [Roseiflexaceae bacterium]